MQQINDLNGKVAIITGGSGVLGEAMATGLALAGVKTGILGRTPKKLENTVDKINALGGKAFPLVADVLDENNLKTAREETLHRYGRIDILINSAGGNLPGATIMPEQSFFDLSIEDFDKVNTLNFKGSLLPSLIFGETMARQQKGVIINISSMAAQKPLTRVVGYSAAKAAIDNFTKWLAIELAQKYGPEIRVNAIAPGFFIADQNKKLLLNPDGTLTPRGETVIQHTPMGKFGEPQDLCGVVNWLCSDSASFVTGAIIPVDGGFSTFSGV
jgi:NAD(P)-dependent dehydrogenase (short-subunit alcohol dehydrogenase family)